MPRLQYRETPFGEPEDRSKRSLYAISDPFFRLWFRMVAPNRSRLARASAEARSKLIEEQWSHLAAATWEEVCRKRVPALTGREQWEPGRRWWHGNQPEWDVVSRSTEGEILLAEAKWSRKPFAITEVRRLAAALRSKPHPELPPADRNARKHWALMLPRVEASVPKEVDGVRVVTGREVFGTRR